MQVGDEVRVARRYRGSRVEESLTGAKGVIRHLFVNRVTDQRMALVLVPEENFHGSHAVELTLPEADLEKEEG